MRILLHVGMPKAGSTALQQSLAANRARLARQGVLYPRAPHFADSQNFLIAGIEDRRRALPRMIRNAYDGRMDEIGPAFARWMGEIGASVAAMRPETMVLSSEWLFGLRDSERFDRLADILRGFGGSLEIVVYVRRPAEQYLSTVQQTLKGSHRIRALTGIRYRVPIEGFARIADTMRVIPYDRSAFPGGDIVGDFLRTFLPDVELPLPPGGTVANATISAEGMAILAGYRRANHRKNRSRFTRDTDRLIDALRDADAAVGGAVRPRLRPEVARAIDAASSDVLWLRDRHGIVFAGLDYEGVEPPGEEEDAEPRAQRPKRIAEICVIDAKREQAVLMHALHALASGEAGASGANWRRVSLWLGGRGAREKR